MNFECQFNGQTEKEYVIFKTTIMKTEMLNKQKYFMQCLQATKNKTKTSQDAQKTIFFIFLPMVIAGTIIKE